MIANVSGTTDEVEKYQAALEGALVWLLQARSSLSGKPDVSEDVKVVKRQFQEHEVGLIGFNGIDKKNRHKN